MEKIECPFCENKFTGYTWEEGTCPKCGEYYFWEEYCNEDFTDCYPQIWWKRFEEEREHKLA